MSLCFCCCVCELLLHRIARVAYSQYVNREVAAARKLALQKQEVEGHVHTDAIVPCDLDNLPQPPFLV